MYSHFYLLVQRKFKNATEKWNTAFTYRVKLVAVALYINGAFIDWETHGSIGRSLHCRSITTFSRTIRRCPAILSYIVNGLQVQFLQLPTQPENLHQVQYQSIAADIPHGIGIHDYKSCFSVLSTVVTSNRGSQRTEQLDMIMSSAAF